MIATDCTGSCKSNYHTITATTASESFEDTKRVIRSCNFERLQLQWQNEKYVPRWRPSWMSDRNQAKNLLAKLLLNLPYNFDGECFLKKVYHEKMQRRP